MREEGRPKLTAEIGALLLSTSRPLTEKRIIEATGVSPSRVLGALEELTTLFDDAIHGFSLHEVNGAWQFRTNPGAGLSIRRLSPPRERRLSGAAAETLAVIAYKQPVQRAEIEAIRGVDALPTLKTLLETRLIRIVGREDAPGQPALYGTTHSFLEKFGLKDLSELPTVSELERLSEEPGEVSEEGPEEDFEEERKEEDSLTPEPTELEAIQ